LSSPVTPTTYMVAMVLARCARPPHSPRCGMRHLRLSPGFPAGQRRKVRCAHGQHSALDIPVGGMLP
jgi:hypothetical protein